MNVVALAETALALMAPASLALPNAGDVLISEFRFRGAAGAEDEFVELYNNTDANIIISTVDGSGGWTLVSDDGVVRATLPNGITIPARGHYLVVNAGAYSLAAHAAGDIFINGGIGDGAGVALFRTSDPANYTLENRLDAVGFAGVTNSLFREGVGFQPGAGVVDNAEFSFARKIIKNGSTAPPQDTNDNASDFEFASTNAGAFSGVQSVMGSPGPENLFGPVNRNTQIATILLDAGVSAAQPPNRVRDTTNTGPNKASGTLSFRRTYVNNTGRTITALRFRNIDITTLHSPGYAPGGPQADFRLLDSPDIQVTLSGGSTVTVKGTTLEQPPSQPLGGGMNSSVKVNLPQGGLAPGQNVSVQFLLGVMQGGTFRFFNNIEATLDIPSAPAAPSGLTAAGVAANQVNLSWVDNSNNETEFRVERKTGAGGTYTHVGTVGSGVTTWADTGLAAGTTTFYRVSAANEGGKSAPSNEASAVVSGPTGNYSLSLNGTSAYVEVPSSGSLNLSGPLTVEAWIKPNSSSLQGIAERYKWLSTPDGGFALRLSSDGKVEFFIIRSNTQVDSVKGSTTVTTGVWHHVAGVFDGNQLRVYLDGVLNGVKTTAITPAQGTANLMIGKVGVNGDNGDPYYFNGLIDDVRVTSGVQYAANFTTSSVLATGSALNNASDGPRGVWLFDNQTASDFSANGNHGTLKGGAGFSSESCYNIKHEESSAGNQRGSKCHHRFRFYRRLATRFRFQGKQRIPRCQFRSHFPGGPAVFYLRDITSTYARRVRQATH